MNLHFRDMDSGSGNNIFYLDSVAAAADKGQPKDGFQNGPKDIQKRGLMQLMKKLSKLPASLASNFPNFLVALLQHHLNLASSVRLV